MALDILIVLGVIYLFIGFFHSLKHVLCEDYKVFNQYGRIIKFFGLALVVTLSFVMITPLWILFYIKSFNKKGE